MASRASASRRPSPPACCWLRARNRAARGLAGWRWPKPTAEGPDRGARQADGPSDPLEKATQYWGKEYAKNPNDLTKALNYAHNLKAMGEKQRALAVLQQASPVHGQNRELASEYGRLALELGPGESRRAGARAAADDPTKPDWRVISARGAVLAKQEKYAEAIPLFERARALSDDQPSVLNNLALAYVMNGEASKAEIDAAHGRRARAGSTPTRCSQNLALVLSLQGKYDEAKRIGSAASSPDTAQRRRRARAADREARAARPRRWCTRAVPWSPAGARRWWRRARRTAEAVPSSRSRPYRLAIA